MHKSLHLLFALLPVCGLGFLAAGPPLLTHLTTLPGTPETRQQRPASLNETRRVVLIAQYRFYLRNHHCSTPAAALYNQCVADSDPSVFQGTCLPRRLP